MKPLRKWRRGDAISAVRLQRMQEGSLLKIRGGSGIRVRRAAGGVVLEAARGAGGGGTSSGGGGTASGIVWHGDVLSLPALPGPGRLAFCNWISTGGGTGDDQVYVAGPSSTRWEPLEAASVLSGVP